MPDQQLFECAAINADRVYTINAAVGSCSCHAAAAHGVCCHLLAAQALPHVALADELVQLSSMDVLTAAECQQLGLAGGEGEAAALRVQRPRRLPRKDGVEEPLGTNWEAELQQLALLRQQQPRAAQRPEAVQAAMAACDRLKALVKVLDEDGAAAVSALLEPALAAAQERQPAFKPSHKEASKQERRRRQRQPTDRVHKPLFPGRRNQRAGSGSSMQQGGDDSERGGGQGHCSNASGEEADSSSDGSIGEETLAQRAERLQLGRADSSSGEDELLVERMRRLHLGFTSVNYHHRLPRGLDGLRRGPSSRGGLRQKRIRDSA